MRRKVGSRRSRCQYNNICDHLRTKYNVFIGCKPCRLVVTLRHIYNNIGMVDTDTLDMIAKSSDSGRKVTCGSFSCCYSKITMHTPCRIRSCRFYSKYVGNSCSINYVRDKNGKGASNVEISLLTGIDTGRVDRLIKRGINYLRGERLRLAIGESLANNANPTNSIERRFGASLENVVKIGMIVFKNPKVVAKVVGINANEVNKVIKSNHPQATAN